MPVSTQTDEVLDLEEPETLAEPGRVTEKTSSKRELIPLDPLRTFGQFLVWTGSLLVLFALFQLWGTGLLEHQAQQALDTEFDALLAEARAADNNPPPAETPIEAVTEDVAEAVTEEPAIPEEPATPEEAAVPEVVEAPVEEPVATPEPPPGPILVPVGSDQLPGEGLAVARINIESIGLSKTIVQGVQRDTLRDGPGHYPTTPMPGQTGNAAIAGHRTTHGAPFFDLDKVRPGDHIDVETLDGVFRYEVQAHSGPDGATRGFFIVDPSDVSVIGDHGDNRLTLTACHPKFSARQRIVVTAQLIGEASPTPVVLAEPTAQVPSLPSELSDSPAAAAEAEVPTGTESVPDAGAQPEPSGAGEEASAEAPGTNSAQVDPGQTITAQDDLLQSSLGWQMEELDPTILWGTVMLVALHAGWVFGRLWRRRYAYPLAFPVAVVPLFICFVHLDRLLPAF